ncbi:MULTISPECIES: LysR family transcriptional regulator [unclassified Pseudoclavibacter]|uniref:LysR family transcriptional regulator n=1 Tax=unclassified Pseudoclavibacter TaxID=2615177 RepID=UPI000CE9041A|nr:MULTISPECIES: LysR family transcriptional regulator [unclassified Pseudoclavibacter]MBF4551120.1 LysR family transcriptional regulator [Pseudoclavibacter sp. VKM Ac-2888]PPF73486.1 LysR family transcriptional regulator [Pseudoclavibacter sp. Z016]
MPEVPIREIECFLVLAEELHFGRTGERLFVSQSRVSQLISTLEQRIGASLVSRSSRRVQLTEFGTEFRDALSPAHRALVEVVEHAQMRARDAPTPIRVGFQGAIYDSIAKAIAQFERAHPQTPVHIKELPLGDPFSDVLAGRVDAAVVLLPVDDPELVVGPIFSRHGQMLAVSVDHPVSKMRELNAEQLSEMTLVPIVGPAPEYWQRVHSPSTTPGGRPVRFRGGASTLQEGLSQVASSSRGLILCTATADYSRRADIAFVPLNGLPESSLALVWRADRETARIREFSSTVDEVVARHGTTADASGTTSFGG